VHPLVPVVELTRSSSPASMLPAALSEALGISLSEVMDHYFNGSDEVERVHMIEDALDSVRGHPSVSLLLLSSPTFYLCIGIPPPHLCTLSKDRTYS
jgi:hypothetical protein